MSGHPSEIGAREIKTFLEELNISPAQLAETLRVSERTVNRWLEKRFRPSGTSAAVLAALMVSARVLRPTFDDLWNGYVLYRKLKSVFEEELSGEMIEALRGEYERLELREDKLRKIETLRRELEEEIRELRITGGDPVLRGERRLKRDRKIPKD